MRMVYTTCGSKKDADTISRSLLKKKLCVCAIAFPARSIYWWDSKLTSSNEYLILLKTTKKLALKLEKELQKIHPYEIPCILSWDIDSNAAYKKWSEGIIR